jgi:hypothetical protein
MVIDEVSDRRKQFSLAPVGDDLGTRHRNKICETVIILIPLCSGRYVCTRTQKRTCTRTERRNRTV